VESPRTTAVPSKKPGPGRHAGRGLRRVFGVCGAASIVAVVPFAIPHAAKRPRPRPTLKPAQAVTAQAEPLSEGTASRATPERMASLSRSLREMTARAPARKAAVYVQDIPTGLTAAAHPNERFLAASLIKLPVMAAAYEHWQTQPRRKTRNALWSLEQMITVSDNASTDRLIDLVGGPEVVTGFCRKRGWPELRVSHAILNHRGRGGLNTCTAREMTEFLVALDRRGLVDETADEEMWRVLLRQKKRRRIPQGLPELPDLEVGNKTGTLGNALHDAGIVHTSTARYALCVLLAHQRSDAAGERFCRQVSRLVFDTLNGPVSDDQVIASR
jgi:beta-lactamase class A